MRCAWTIAVAVAALSRAVTACDRTRVRAPTLSSWTATCAAGAAAAAVAFDPAPIGRFMLTKDASVRVTSDVLLPSTFDGLDALASSTITHFTLQAEPQYVHKVPVEIAPTAFANLTALETLTLQDVPLVEPSLHLVLPPTIKKVVIVGCKLQQFSFEMVGGAAPKALLEIDLHANNLVEIPDNFYSLPPNVINLDIRLNKLSTISVPSSHVTTLQQWMKKGVLQIDNLKNPCSLGGKSTQVQGLSQVFDVCVVDGTQASIRSRAADSVTPSPSPAHSAVGSIPVTEAPAATESDIASEAVDLPPAKVHSPIEDAGEASPKPTNRPTTPEDNATTKSSQLERTPIIYVALIGLGAVGALLVAFSFVLVVARYRQQSGRKKSNSSFLTSAASEDFSMMVVERKVSDASSRSSSGSMMTPLPDFKNVTRMNRTGRSSSDGSTAATPIHQNGESSQYTTMTTPQGKNGGYVMSKSLQSLTGVSQFSIASLEHGIKLRQANKEKMRTILSDIATKRGAIEVDKTIYTCFGDVVETEAGALMVQCQATTFVEDGATPQPLSLKVYVEQDIRAAIKEYRALLVMQSNTCKQFVSQMVATDMEKRLDGLKCAVIVVEKGSPTTFRHVVRGQIDRTQQYEVVQQLYAVVKALECLHERQFIHGGLHLDALVIHPSETNRLKFQDLEHAARFGDIMAGLTPITMLEYFPPEMARHLVCSGQGPRPSSLDTLTADSYQVLRASASYDVWCLGILILKIYANTKHLDEFQGCHVSEDFYLKLSEDNFDFERSLELYVHHDDVRDLARVCLRRDPRKRPKIANLLTHRVFRAYDRLEEGDLVASFNTYRLQAENKNREVLPPALWLFLPPRELGLAKTRTVDEWVSDITNFQQRQRQGSKFRSGELMFPVLFMCENSKHANAPCSLTGFRQSRWHLPASLLSLAMPLVQETTLFLEAKSIVSEKPHLSIAELSGLGTHQWIELVKFYRALEKMMLAPISSFSLLLLKPLEEMLARKDPEVARQVLDELKCLVFSQDKRDHVLSLLDILKTISINSDLDDDDQDETDIASVSEDGETETTKETNRPLKEWSRLRKCEIESEGVASMPPSRWLCRRHWECEMECEV